MNVPTLGFAPIIYTQPLGHAHNEYIQADVFLYGIKVFKKVIKKLGNV